MHAHISCEARILDLGPLLQFICDSGEGPGEGRVSPFQKVLLFSSPEPSYCDPMMSIVRCQ